MKIKEKGREDHLEHGDAGGELSRIKRLNEQMVLTIKCITICICLHPFAMTFQGLNTKIISIFEENV